MQRARKNWHGLTRRVILIGAFGVRWKTVWDDAKCALFIFVTLRTKYRSKKDGWKEGGAISTRHEIYIFTSNSGHAPAIEIAVASGTNKISLPSVSPVFPRTCRFFSVSRQTHNRQNWDTQVRMRIRIYTRIVVAAAAPPSLRTAFLYRMNNISRVRRKCIRKCARITTRKRFRQRCKLLCVKFLRNGISPHGERQ